MERQMLLLPGSLAKVKLTALAWKFSEGNYPWGELLQELSKGLLR